MSTSEYVKQRALGFEPKAVLPDAFFRFCEKFDALIDMGISKDVEAEAFNLLAEISDVLIKPRKEQLFGVPAKRNTLCGEKEHPRIDEPFDTRGKSDKKECDATWRPQDSGP